MHMCSLTDIFTNIVHIETNSARLDKRYHMRQRSGHAQFEITNDRFSGDAVYNATQQYI